MCQHISRTLSRRQRHDQNLLLHCLCLDENTVVKIRLWLENKHGSTVDSLHLQCGWKGEQTPCSCMTVICQGESPVFNFIQYDVKGADMDQLTRVCSLKHCHAPGCTVARKFDCSMSNFSRSGLVFNADSATFCLFWGQSCHSAATDLFVID